MTRGHSIVALNLILLFPDDFLDETTVRLTGRRLAHVTAVHRANVGDSLVVGVQGSGIGRGEVTRDDGPGAPAEHRDRIFDRFHRADASRSRATGGAGLGLAIAKELVELHGGKIWLEGSSTFVFTLVSSRA